ncbi:MAG: glycosyltransferase family 39 protein [Anaerolineae bacterium]|nr:glycosyltransferase family 39 protein [Anaerolineae bacterium]NUQ03486.1 glycosyltransferase family 39 protein [Anaerolineae bacterium]
MLLFAAFLIRLRDIETQSLWFDEGWSAYAAEQPSLIAAFNADATNPPLYYGLLHIAASAFGTSEFSLRFVSLLWGLPVSALTVLLAQKLAGGRAGLTTAALALFSAPLWWASQEARMYTLLALLVLGCAFAWERLLHRPTRAAWLALWTLECLILYAHNTGPVVFLWLNSVTALWWLSRRSFDKPNWRLWFAGQIGVGVLWLPYFVGRFLLLPGANSAVQSSLQVSEVLPRLLALWNSMWSAPPISLVEGLGQSDAPMLVATLILLLCVAAGVLASRRLGVHILLLTAYLVLGLALLGNDLHGRYLVMIAPLLIVAAGIGLSRFALPLRAVGIAAALAVFALSLSAAHLPEHGHDDARGMVRYYAETLTADDTVLAWSYADRYELAYYWDRLSTAARRVTLPEGEDLDTVALLLPTSGRVGLNVWYTQRADYRGMMGCLLGHGADAAPLAFTTAGMTNLLYDRAPASLPVLRDVDWTFRDGSGVEAGTVRAVGELPAFASHQSLCLPLTLHRGSVGADVKAAVIVRNTLGDPIAQIDAVFAAADQRLTGALPPDERAAAFPLVQLPYGAPAGEYGVYLRLYSERATSGADSVDYEPPRRADITVVGRDVLIGMWRASEGDWGVQEDGSAPARLTGHEVVSPDGSVIRNGEVIHLTLIWEGRGVSEAVSLSDDAGRWCVESDSPAGDVTGARREWHRLRVPSNAPSGEAVVRVGGEVIARYTVESAPMLTERPPADISLDARFAEAGALVGASLPDQPLSRDSEPVMTLIWRAADVPTAESLIVFVQLLDGGSNVIAQSDSAPAAGARPTSGWRAGEYIVDEHRLHFSSRAVPGAARLIAGLYDPLTGRRVLLTEDADFAVIVENVAVE